MNLLRDANLQLRSQVFDLNQDVSDLLEIVENLKNRRMVSHEHFLHLLGERNDEKKIDFIAAISSEPMRISISLEVCQLKS